MINFFNIMEINFVYKVPYRPNPHYKFKQYDEKIGVEAYKEPLLKKFNTVIDRLSKNPNSRTAVVDLFHQNDFESCLLTIQVQLNDNKLYLTANYRSQAAIYRSKDEEMLCYLVYLVIKKLKLPDDTLVDITCNIGNYHINRFNQ